MRFQKLRMKAVIGIALVFALIIGLSPMCSYAAPANSNRFNVVMVLDASGSMKKTDPQGFRYEAISQFTNLLAESGNYLGGIVFSTEISVNKNPVAVNSQKDKEQITSSLRSVLPSGYTNTGDALLAAVKALEKNGNPDLPSVIVFLSDGNTEMPTKDKVAKSLNLKADAIQQAREQGIQIYSICLNANNRADVSEMEQVSNATDGVFEEVKSAKDLGNVFNAFYNLIYGTSTVTFVDEKFPGDGVIKKDFTIPPAGVEEVNIIIYGKTSDFALFRPNGEKSNAVVARMNSLTMLKIKDIEPGVWRIVARGVPHDHIKINMVYNTDLSIDAKFANDGDILDTKKPVRIVAVLRSHGQLVPAEGYQGYAAKIHVLNPYDEEIEAAQMKLINDHFEFNRTFNEGTYKFKATVGGNHIKKESDLLGPLEIHAVKNTPPAPIQTPVKHTVYIWPFKDASLSIDMSQLASDKEDKVLSYRIMSSSFIEGKDYSVHGNTINLKNFSLSKGAFDIKAVDSSGGACNIEIIVKAYNVGIMALIGLSIGALLVLAIFGILLYIALKKPFRGSISAYVRCDGRETGRRQNKKRGRIRLSAFGMSPTGLDHKKSYFQATGKDYIYLVTDKPVTCRGVKTNKIKVKNGIEEIISVKDDCTLYVRFESVLHR